MSDLARTRRAAFKRAVKYERALAAHNRFIIRSLGDLLP